MLFCIHSPAGSSENKKEERKTTTLLLKRPNLTGINQHILDNFRNIKDQHCAGMLILPYMLCLQGKKKKLHENLTQLRWYSLATNFNICFQTFHKSAVLYSKKCYPLKKHIPTSLKYMHLNLKPCKAMDINNSVTVKEKKKYIHFNSLTKKKKPPC